MALEKTLQYIIIAKEWTKQDDVHYHCFGEFRDNIHIRNREKFLINGAGVNLQRVGKSKADKEKIVIYCQKGGDYDEPLGPFNFFPTYRGYVKGKADLEEFKRDLV